MRFDGWGSRRTAVTCYGFAVTFLRKRFENERDDVGDAVSELSRVGELPRLTSFEREADRTSRAVAGVELTAAKNRACPALAAKHLRPRSILPARRLTQFWNV